MVTARENARCQGFPDYHMLVGLDSSGRGLSSGYIMQRYKQVSAAGGAGGHGRGLGLRASYWAPMHPLPMSLGWGGGA